MSRLPSRVTIELAPNDARRLVALTEQRKGYDSPAHRADVAGDLLRDLLHDNRTRGTVAALVIQFTDSAAFSCRDGLRSAYLEAAAALSRLLDEGAL